VDGERLRPIHKRLETFDRDDVEVGGAVAEFSRLAVLL
jgi:hypothetical protein